MIKRHAITHTGARALTLAFFSSVFFTYAYLNLAYAHAYQDHTNNAKDTLETLTNYQVNTPSMVSAGLPTFEQLALLKSTGVERVIDLIPGDRSDEILATHQLGLNYHNVPVAWTNPTLDDYKNYTAYMALGNADNGKVLTHCKLNWRGATFTYLYRITTLREDEKIAKQDLLAIWQPNQTWFTFINTVIDDYNLSHQQHVSTSLPPQPPAPE
jgi:protein tyrosine phosphatase (PTP) superfamily phosphohydrolase (DUF442 family)